MIAQKSRNRLSQIGPANGFSHSDAPKNSIPSGKANLMNSSEMLLETLKRIPGLFRRWELNEVLEPQGRYRIEDAGTHADGTPLLAVYTSDRVGETTDVDNVTYDAPSSDDPRSIIPDGLLPKRLVSRLPLIIEVDVADDDEPKMVPLFGPQGATLADLYLAIEAEREICRSASETEKALSVLLDCLLARGATPETHVCAALGMIATVGTVERDQ